MGREGKGKERKGRGGEGRGGRGGRQSVRQAGRPASWPLYKNRFYREQSPLKPVLGRLGKTGFYWLNNMVSYHTN